MQNMSIAFKSYFLHSSNDFAQIGWLDKGRGPLWYLLFGGAFTTQKYCHIAKTTSHFLPCSPYFFTSLTTFELKLFLYLSHCLQNEAISRRWWIIKSCISDGLKLLTVWSNLQNEAISHRCWIIKSCISDGLKLACRYICMFMSTHDSIIVMNGEICWHR